MSAHRSLSDSLVFKHLKHSIDLKYYFEYDSLKWVRIDEIAVEDYSGVVMDIEVEEDHSFISAGVVVSNCYVIPSPDDSRQGILDNLKVMTEIMARGGGVGINLSTLRPRGSYIKTVNGTASGPCSWAQLYSVATGDVIQQGGSRRGALMLMLDDNHPDIEEFITVKRTAGKIEHANLSVCISDKFMEAVKNDADWDLVWQDKVHEDHPRPPTLGLDLHLSVGVGGAWHGVYGSVQYGVEYVVLREYTMCKPMRRARFAAMGRL